MRRMRTRWAWGLLTLTVLLAGCKFKRVEDDRSVSVAAGAAKIAAVGEPMWSCRPSPRTWTSR